MKADYTGWGLLRKRITDGDNRQMKADYTQTDYAGSMQADGDNRQMKADYTTDVIRHAFYEGD